jgi:hypothetical protein
MSERTFKMRSFTILIFILAGSLVHTAKSNDCDKPLITYEYLEGPLSLTGAKGIKLELSASGKITISTWLAMRPTWKTITTKNDEKLAKELLKSCEDTDLVGCIKSTDEDILQEAIKTGHVNLVDFDSAVENLTLYTEGGSNRIHGHDLAGQPRFYPDVRSLKVINSFLKTFATLCDELAPNALKLSISVLRDNEVPWRFIPDDNGKEHRNP